MSRSTRPKSKSQSRRAKDGGDGRITVHNVNVPGYTTRVDARMYRAMYRAMMAVLPSAPPGLTQTQIRQAVVRHLPASLYPGGAKAEWWSKMVQLDLEAKGEVAREASKPLRWFKTSGGKR